MNGVSNSQHGFKGIVSINIFCFILLCMVSLLGACKEDNKGRIDPGPDAKEVEQAYFEDYVSPEHKWGYINEIGEVIIKPKYDMVHDMKTPCTGANYLGKWGFIDQKGTEIIPFIYKQVYPFEKNVGLVQDFDNNWIILNQDGKVIKKLDYDNVRPWKSGMSIVVKDNLQGLINTDGAIIIKPQYDQIKVIDSERFIVFKNGESEVVSVSGEILLSGFNKIYPPVNGLYRVKNGKKYKYVNEMTMMVSPSVYDKAFDFHYERTIAFINDNYVLITQDFEPVITLPFEKIEYAGERKWKYFKDGKWGILDENGSQMSSPKFDLLNKFVDGHICFSIDDKWGYANGLALKVIPASYLLAWDFHKGKARVIGNRGVGFIDVTNKMVVPDLFFEVRDFQLGKARFQTF